MLSFQEYSSNESRIWLLNPLTFFLLFKITPTVLLQRKFRLQHFTHTDPNRTERPKTEQNRNLAARLELHFPSWHSVNGRYDFTNVPNSPRYDFDVFRAGRAAMFAPEARWRGKSNEPPSGLHFLHGAQEVDICRSLCFCFDRLLFMLF